MKLAQYPPKHNEHGFSLGGYLEKKGLEVVRRSSLRIDTVYLMLPILELHKCEGQRHYTCFTHVRVPLFLARDIRAKFAYRGSNLRSITFSKARDEFRQPLLLETERFQGSRKT
jgi:hypothetical protein